MRSFKDIDSLWADALDEVLSCGKPLDSRAGASKEIIGYAARLDASQQRTFLTNARRNLDPCYAAAEVLWYLSGTDDATMIMSYAPQYANFIEPGTVRAYGAYGNRLVSNLSAGYENTSLLDIAIDLLRTEPNTRQCVVSLWTPHDLVMSAMKSNQRPKDIPCTLTWKFYARNGKLNMCVDMRSNDLVLGMPYDIFAFTCIQRLVANELGIDVGDYVHTVGSLHLYEKHYELGKEAYLASSTAMREQHGWSNHDKLEHVETALYAERLTRHDLKHKIDAAALPIDGMLNDLLSCCALKFNVQRNVTSDALRNAMTRRKEKR